jgi:tetratricopeptide (TPR) repeat protein
VLEAFPKNPQAALQLGELIVQHVHENDLDKEEQLSKAEKVHQPGAGESRHQAERSRIGCTVGAGQEVREGPTAERPRTGGSGKRKKFDIAIADFKLAADGDPQPAYQVRLASAYQQSGNNAEALAICDKLLADPQLHPAIRQVAEGVKAKAQAKTGAGK